MKNNILIFIDNIRPDENWLGLINIFDLAESDSRLTVVGSIEKRYEQYIGSNVTIQADVTLKELWLGDIFFGLPSKYSLFKILNIWSSKRSFFTIGPGKVTKAIGLFKHPDKTFYKKIIGFSRYLIPGCFYIAQDLDDAMYLATANGRDISLYLPIGLPKTAFITLELAKKKSRKKIGVLFAPTHRWDGCVSVINQWLSDDLLSKRLTLKYDLFHTGHPDDIAIEISDLIVKVKDLDHSVWKYIDVLVTDYSSIAHDFLSSGGQNVVNIISDLAGFENNQGKSPLSLERQFPGILCNTEAELVMALGISESVSGQIDITSYCNSWVKRLLEHKVL